MAMLAFPVLVGFVIFLAIAVTAFFLQEERKTRRKLRRAPVRTIADMMTHGGLGKIVGEVQPVGEVLTAPLSKRRCVLFHVDVFESQMDRSGSDSSRKWVRIAGDYKATLFTIDDGTGTAIIDADFARFSIDRDYKSRSGLFDDAEGTEVEYLEAKGIATKGRFFNKSLRFKEGVLEVGERVAVLGGGFAQIDPDGDEGGYRDAPAMRLSVSGSPGYPLFISDHSGTKK